MAQALTIIRQALSIAAALAATIAVLKCLGVSIPAVRASITDLGWITIACAAAVYVNK